MLEKKRGYFIQNSTLLVPKYIQRQKIITLGSKIFPTENIAKKEGVLRTEFTIPSSKYFQTYANTIPRLRIFSTKNAGKKQGVCWTEITVLIKNFRIKSKFLDPKYFWGQKNTNVDKVCKNSEGVIGKNSEGLMGKKF